MVQEVLQIGNDKIEQLMTSGGRGTTKHENELEFSRPEWKKNISTCHIPK